MAVVPASKTYIQLPSALTRAPVGESLAQSLGSTNNYLLDTEYCELTWKLNGSIKVFDGLTGVDGIQVAREGIPWEIFDVMMYGETMGTGGITEFDIERSAFNAGSFGAWSTIFGTRPFITDAAAAYTTVHVGTPVTGCQAPLLTSNPDPLVLDPRDRFRLVVVSVQTGSPLNFGITLFLRGSDV